MHFCFFNFIHLKSEELVYPFFFFFLGGYVCEEEGEEGEESAEKLNSSWVYLYHRHTLRETPWGPDGDED